MTVRTAARLADGREIIYFDQSDHARQMVEDRRDTATVQTTSTVRLDRLTGEWIAIAGHRQTRIYHPPIGRCPLCPSTRTNASEIPAPDYEVVVFQNKFPSFAGTGPPAHPQELFTVAAGNGRCEVMCFSSDHTATFSQLSTSRVDTVIAAWADRTAALSALPGIEQIFCFENRGTEIGVTLAHPHSQIYGYPYVTPRTASTLRQVETYRATNDGNLFGDLIAAEIADGSRIVAQNEHWIAFVPFAARWPVEVHLFLRWQVPDLPALTPPQKLSLAPIYLEVLRRLEGVFQDSLPAVTAWHQAPVHTGRDDFWLHLQIFTIRRDIGKIKYLAGSESAMGAFVNDISPEDAAQRLRQVPLSTADDLGPLSLLSS